MLNINCDISMPRPIDPNIGENYISKQGVRRNKEKHKLYVMKRRDERKLKLVEHFNNKCGDCGGVFPPCCYDFHHVDPSTKSFEIAPRLDGNFETILKEAEKCIMICANCHRVRHYKENR